MSEAGQNSTRKPGSDIEQLLVNIQNLDAEGKKDFVARSMTQILQDPQLLAQAVSSIENVEAKKAAATSAVKSVQGSRAEEEVVAETVRSAESVEAKKAAATSAVESAQDGEEGQVVAQAVRSTSTLEGKKAAATSAVESAQDGEEGQVVAQAVRSTSTLEGKKAAATSAVESAQNGGKKEVATSAVEAAGIPAQEKILAELQSTLGDFRKLILQTIAWSGAIMLVVFLVVLFMSFQGELGAADLFVTISIAVLATLAGYCLGAASLLAAKLKERRNP
jgi:hypothetical protein